MRSKPHTTRLIHPINRWQNLKNFESRLAAVISPS